MDFVIDIKDKSNEKENQHKAICSRKDDLLWSEKIHPGLEIPTTFERTFRVIDALET